MLRSFRAALARFCVRRAAASQRDAPRRALSWLRLGARLSPAFAETYPALVHLSRALDDRLGAVDGAREATVRFPENADAWMLLGEALEMAFRQHDALGAYEQALALEERADAAMAAGALYLRAGSYADAAARYARAYAAGGGATALWHNAQALYEAGDHSAADAALDLWATQVENGHDRLSAARAELRGGARGSGGAAGRTV
jgi:tetratricopeptide (TPR) repeat protein